MNKRKLRRLRIEPAMTGIHGRLHIFQAKEPTPPKRIKRLLREHEERLKHNPNLGFLFPVYNKNYEIKGVYDNHRKMLVNPKCKLGFLVRGHISGSKVESAFMDVEGNFHEVRHQLVKKRADWAAGHPTPSLDYHVKLPFLTGKATSVKRQVADKVKKFAEIIIPKFFEALDDDTPF